MVSPVYGQGVIPASGGVTAELNAITRRAYVPKMVVQIYKAAPLLSMAMRNSQKARGGLSQVSVPIQGAPYVTFNWTDYSGTFQQPTNVQGTTAAAWNLSVGIVPIPLLGMESLVQATEAIIPLVKARMADAKTVAIQSIATALYGTAGVNTLQINGLRDVYDNGTVAPTYGGIPRGANPFWNSTVISSAIAPSRDTIITQIMQLTKLAGGESPDFVIMSLGDWTTLVQDFMSAEQFHTTPSTRYGMDDAVNAGFRALMVGNVPVLADPFCPTGTAYLINSRYLSLYISEDANFAFSGFNSLLPNNQLASVGVVIAAMALVCTKPVSGSQLSNLTGAPF